MLSVPDACRAFREQHEASPSRRAVLDAMLAKACAAFGDVAIEALTPEQLAAWRASMPPPTRWQATQALAQVTRWALAWGLVSVDPMSRVPNPRPRLAPVQPFGSWEEIERLAAALPDECRLLPLVGAGCGLRPGELLGLTWRSVDLDARTVRVEQSLDGGGRVQRTLKTRGSRRAVPLRRRLAEQLEAARPRDAHEFVIRSRSGGPADLRNLRRRAWRPALVAAGIEHPHRIYDLRHTYATWALAAGVSTFQLARRMGTSIDMIDLTYGHLTADAADHELALLDAWDGDG